MMCYADISFYLKHHGSSSNETKSWKSYVFNQDTLRGLTVI